MRVKEEEKVENKKKILDFLKTKSPCNLSEIARAVNRAPPTVKKYIDDLIQEGRVSLDDKKSMKLIKLVRS